MLERGALLADAEGVAAGGGGECGIPGEQREMVLGADPVGELEEAAFGLWIGCLSEGGAKQRDQEPCGCDAAERCDVWLCSGHATPAY